MLRLLLLFYVIYTSKDTRPWEAGKKEVGAKEPDRKEPDRKWDSFDSFDYYYGSGSKYAASQRGDSPASRAVPRPPGYSPGGPSGGPGPSRCEAEYADLGLFKKPSLPPRYSQSGQPSPPPRYSQYGQPSQYGQSSTGRERDELPITGKSLKQRRTLEGPGFEFEGRSDKNCSIS